MAIKKAKVAKKAVKKVAKKAVKKVAKKAVKKVAKKAAKKAAKRNNSLQEYPSGCFCFLDYYNE